jgi:diguanylate cyclase (GGDEF)-like protein
METSVNVKEMSQTQRKSFIEQREKAYDDWQITIEKKIDTGILTKEDGRRMISRALTARDIKNDIVEYKLKVDELTGLYNRRAFNKEYVRITSNGSKFALLIIDLDNFKEVNKKLGYLAGNNIIVQMGANFLGNLRQVRENKEDNDFICRWGGDEFVIILKNIDKNENLEKVTEKFKKMTSERAFSVNINDAYYDVPAEFSIGAGIYRGEDKDIFFNKVNDAIKRAKTTGKNKIEIVNI